MDGRSTWMDLRPPQLLKETAIYTAWNNGFRNIASIDACGSGKTVLTAKIFEKRDAPMCVIAHRQELTCQMSTAMAANGVYHRIIGPRALIKLVVQNHMDTVGANFYDPSSRIAVAGVDTLIRRRAELAGWAKTVRLWSIDECHHLQRANKWGKAALMFPADADGLGTTATLERADGRGLGRDNDGLYDIILNGPSPRDQINAGYLTDYRIHSIDAENFNRKNITVGNNGEFSKNAVDEETRNSAIVGNIVEHYLRIAKNKLAVVFLPNCDEADKTAREFVAHGVAAAVITAKTPTAERIRLLAKFKKRELLVLVNVDLFGEGFDLPAIEVVILGRATNSYGLYHQQFMRALRLMISEWLSKRWGSFTDNERLNYIACSEKPYAIVIDHVGNINTELGGHGLPDEERVYTLDRKPVSQRITDPDVIPTRRCLNPECNSVYQRIHKSCPFCGFEHIPISYASVEHVDGDLTELDELTLARMRGEVENVDMTLVEYRAYMEAKRAPYIHSHLKRHKEQQEALAALRASISWWGGFQRHKKRDDAESYRRFYWKFGVDVLSAQSLKTVELFKLTTQINEVLSNEFDRVGH